MSSNRVADTRSCYSACERAKVHTPEATRQSQYNDCTGRCSSPGSSLSSGLESPISSPSSPIMQQMMYPQIQSPQMQQHAAIIYPPPQEQFAQVFMPQRFEQPIQQFTRPGQVAREVPMSQGFDQYPIQLNQSKKRSKSRQVPTQRFTQAGQIFMPQRFEQPMQQFTQTGQVGRNFIMPPAMDFAPQRRNSRWGIVQDLPGYRTQRIGQQYRNLDYMLPQRHFAMTKYSGFGRKRRSGSGKLGSLITKLNRMKARSQRRSLKK